MRCCRQQYSAILEMFSSISPPQPCLDTPVLGSHTSGTSVFLNHSRCQGWFEIPSACVTLLCALPNRGGEERERKGALEEEGTGKCWLWLEERAEGVGLFSPEERRLRGISRQDMESPPAELLKAQQDSSLVCLI